MLGLRQAQRYTYIQKDRRSNSVTDGIKTDLEREGGRNEE